MASTYLQRTFGTPTSRKIFTVSLWFKRASLGSTQNFFGNGTGTNTDGFGLIDFLSDDRFRVTETPDYATQNYDIVTSRKFRDTSAWYHVVVAFDTTQATASDRIKLYVNGVQETSLDTASYPALNLDTKITLNNSHMISRRVNSATDYFDGSMAHYHFIDGTAYDASAFGETDATTGIWKPKLSPSVTYGTNGFFLKFENSGSMGTDSSGNGNNFTVNGTLTQTVDTPSNVFATLNPLYKGVPANPTFSNGNLTIAPTAADYQNAFSSIAPSAGKWYMEMKANGTPNSGNEFSVNTEANLIYFTTNSNAGGITSDSCSIKMSTGEKRINGTLSSYGTAFSNGDIMMCALDLDNQKVFFGKNGTWFNSGDPATGTNPASSALSSTTIYFIGCAAFSGGFSSLDFNFGNGYFGTTAVSSAQNPDDGIGIFEYTVPTGYKALCTKSINAQEYA